MIFSDFTVRPKNGIHLYRGKESLLSGDKLRLLRGNKLLLGKQLLGGKNISVGSKLLVCDDNPLDGDMLGANNPLVNSIFRRTVKSEMYKVKFYELNKYNYFFYVNSMLILCTDCLQL